MQECRSDYRLLRSPDTADTEAAEGHSIKGAIVEIAGVIVDNSTSRQEPTRFLPKN
ncbi:hypothetical protein QUB70_12525 [Microcoleus sp. A003_D6]|uniref:hypothetical protein n=1 Tax=Microcoleus sp. A003_D6 TaxID=3055266 RepID=UPI002FD79608